MTGSQLAEILRGKADDAGTLDVDSIASGSTTALTGTIADDLVSGTVRLASVSHAFNAEPATGSAGYYATDAHEAPTGVTGGWIVLPDGTERGTVKSSGAIVANPSLVPQGRRTVDLAVVGVGDITAHPAPSIDPICLPVFDPRLLSEAGGAGVLEQAAQ